MKRALAFITFEELVSKNQIAFRFQHIRNSQHQQNSAFELIAVRHKLIYEYWYNHVIKHFGFILLVATIITHLAITKNQCTGSGYRSYIILFSHAPLLLQVYFQLYSTSECEMIKEEYEHNLSEEVRKCRKAQYPNFTLLLIDHVRNEISAMPPASCDDKSAIMLTQLYGVDTGSMKKALKFF